MTRSSSKVSTSLLTSAPAVDGATKAAGASAVANTASEGQVVQGDAGSTESEDALSKRGDGSEADDESGDAEEEEAFGDQEAADGAEESQKTEDKGTVEGSGAKDGPPDTKGWQAVWEPNYQAYYFYNASTGVTTWENPLVKGGEGSKSAGTDSIAGGGTSSSSSTSAAAATSSVAAGADAAEPLDPIAAAAAAQGIDPDLAFLDPARFRAATSAAAGGSGAPSLSGHFDARTGRFVPAPLATGSRDPSQFSDVERSKRLAAHYFDQEAWERERDEERKRKRAKEEEGVDESGKGKWKSKREREEIRKRQAAKKEKKHAWLRT